MTDCIAIKFLFTFSFDNNFAYQLSMLQPINKAKLSKRVHHISNLTTALTALRRRGLDLVNNNPADIADGNPRIVLGLVWQIILHFQV